MKAAKEIKEWGEVRYWVRSDVAMSISGGKYILHGVSERCGRFKQIAVA
jgi:hypothetical protein